MTSIESAIYETDTEAPCPRCSYPLWIRMIEVVAQAWVVCPACRMSIHLVDANASVSGAAREFDRAVEDVAAAFRKASRRRRR